MHTVLKYINLYFLHVSVLQVKRISDSVRLTFPDVEKFPNFTEMSSLQIPTYALTGN